MSKQKVRFSDRFPDFRFPSDKKVRNTEPALHSAKRGEGKRKGRHGVMRYTEKGKDKEEKGGGKRYTEILRGIR